MEWIEANADWLWLVLALGLVGAELLSLDLVLAMLAAGALSAGVTALAGAPLGLQLGVFVVVSLLTLVAVRPAAMRRLHPDPAAGASWLDGLSGRRLTATGPVTDEGGRIDVDGETWSARVEPGAAPAAHGQGVTVLRVEGAHLILRPDPVIDWDAPAHD